MYTVWWKGIFTLTSVAKEAWYCLYRLLSWTGYACNLKKNLTQLSNSSPLSMLWCNCTLWRRCELWRAKIRLVISSFCHGENSMVAVWPDPSSLQRVWLARLMNYGCHKQQFYIVSQARPTFVTKEMGWMNCAYKLCPTASYSGVMVLAS